MFQKSDAKIQITITTAYLISIRPKHPLFNCDKICRSYSDLNFGVTFWNTVYIEYSVVVSAVVVEEINDLMTAVKVLYVARALGLRLD